jgi:nitrogen fixation NifU-like protein
MSDLYRDNILDHYKNPRNFGSLKNPDVIGVGDNPLCGDCLSVELKCDKKGILTDVAFSAKGCALSVASASILSESLRGMSVARARELRGEDIQELIEVSVGPGRLKCALLPLVALQQALKKLSDTTTGDA